MSWLARSIADSLRIADDDGGQNIASPNHKQSQHREIEEEEEEEQEQDDEEQEEDDDEDEDRSGRGVREDLTEFTETLTRQLWGVASFLASPRPPPPPPPPPLRPIHRSIAVRNRWEQSDLSCSGDDSEGEVGISTQSRFTAYEEEVDPIGEAVGVTEEVLAFAMNIAHHPETWLDYPLEEEDDVDGFDMSDAQHEHVLAIQRLAPRLAALRIELCPAHMSDAYFWKVYFVLLHSRLNKQDAELLSTPQVMAARAMWMQELQKRTKKETHQFGATSYINQCSNSWQDSSDHASYDDDHENTSNYCVNTEIEAEKYPVAITGIQIVDKSVIEEEPVLKTEDKDLVPGPSFKVPVQSYEDDEDDDDWLKEDSELDGYSGTTILLGTHEDVSFSDLEDDDDCTMPIKSKIVTVASDKSPRNAQG